MRYDFNELKKKYLDLLEKREDGEELKEMEEYALNSIIAVSKNYFYGEKSAIERFFTALDRLLQAEDL